MEDIMKNLSQIDNLLRHQKLSTGEKLIAWLLDKSMEPHLARKQFHELSPTTWGNCRPGDIVFCRIGDMYFTRLVIRKDPEKGLLVVNGRGLEKAWTREAFGKVTKIINKYAV